MPLNKRKKRVAGRVNDPQYPSLTFDQAINHVMGDKRAEGLRDRTLQDYERMWRYFMDWFHDNYEAETVDELTTEVIRNYINFMKYDKQKYAGHKYITADQGVGLSDTTININLRCLRSIFNHLDREELIEVNPMDRVKLIRQDTDDLRDCLTDDEVKEILRQPNQRDYAGFRDYCAMNVLLDSGLRAGELLSLRQGDIEFKNRFITISATVNKSRRVRIVPVSSFVSKLLMQLIAENMAHFKTDRIFLSSFGEPLGQNHFNKRLKYYAEKAGYDVKSKKYTAHAYRHTWGKSMILNGCDLFTLQKMGGWNDVRTLRKYIQMDHKDIRKSHDNYSPVMAMRQKRT